LGLAVVHRTILDHNGRIEIDTGEKGTMVTLFLPTVQAAYIHEPNPHR
jgi:nitrogen-specific signal transduction histidine kinase